MRRWLPCAPPRMQPLRTQHRCSSARELIPRIAWPPSARIHAHEGLASIAAFENLFVRPPNGGEVEALASCKLFRTTSNKPVLYIDMFEGRESANAGPELLNACVQLVRVAGHAREYTETEVVGYVFAQTKKPARSSGRKFWWQQQLYATMEADVLALQAAMQAHWCQHGFVPMVAFSVLGTRSE